MITNMAYVEDSG